MLNSIFSDNMMLQCDMPVNVCGTGSADQPISIELAANKAETLVSEDGGWLVTLPSLESGQKCEMRVKGEEGKLVKNILAGDV